MKYALPALVLVSCVSAAAIHARFSGECCFQIEATDADGKASGVIGQLGDGQNRIGGPYPPSTYCICEDQISDEAGRGCITTPKIGQFQCDAGFTPEPGYSISSIGGIEFNGTTTFYACPYNQYGGYNLYTQPVAGQPYCIEVSLSTVDGKCATEPVPFPPPSQSKGVTNPTPTKTSISALATTTVTSTAIAHTCSEESQEGCHPQSTLHSFPVSTPTCTPLPNLSSEYQYPHQICMVHKDNPSADFCGYSPTISKDSSAVFSFDIPESYAGKMCSLVFLFPRQVELETSSFVISGAGAFDVQKLSEPAPANVSYSNLPKFDRHMIGFNFAPGHEYSIETVSCAAGKAVSYLFGASGSLTLTYFQDYNPAPIGAYITTC